MAIHFTSIGQIEHAYAFEKAVVKTDTLNGTFGEVVDGVFTPAENATKAIMQLEVGDDIAMPEYKIAANTPVRVIDFASLVEQFPKNTEVQIYDYPLPAEFAEGDKLASDADGKLVVGASAAPYFEIVKVVGNKRGVVAKYVAE